MVDSSEYILSGPDNSLEFEPELSALDVLCERLKNNGNDLSQIDAETGKTITYSEFYRVSTSIATNLTQQHGLTQGDTVTLCCESCIDSFCMLFGVIFTGATAAIISTKVKHDDLQQLLDGTKSKLIYCSEDSVEAVSKAVPEGSKVVVCNAQQHSSSYIDYSSLVKDDYTTSFQPFKVTDVKEHTPILLFSSGTTGKPKGILVTNVGLLRIAEMCKPYIKIFITQSVFSWITAAAMTIIGITNKFKVVWCPPDREKLLKYTERYKANTWMLTPGSMNELSKHPNLNKYDISSVIHIFATGAVLTKTLRESFLRTVCKHKVNLMCIYGSSEVGFMTEWQQPVDSLGSEKATSVGKLCNGSYMKFINEKGEAMGPNIDGEILIKSTGAMKGYWGIQEAQAGLSVDNEGWFHTGDIGHCDKDGYIYVLGRQKDIVSVRNKKVSLVELESLIMSHPDVFEATVVSKPHPVDTNHLITFVVRKNGKSNLTESDIIKFVEGQGDDTQQLQGGVIFLDSIPRTTAGKVHKFILQKQLNDFLN